MSFRRRSSLTPSGSSHYLNPYSSSYLTPGSSSSHLSPSSSSYLSSSPSSSYSSSLSRANRSSSYSNLHFPSSSSPAFHYTPSPLSRTGSSLDLLGYSSLRHHRPASLHSDLNDSHKLSSYRSKSHKTVEREQKEPEKKKDFKELYEKAVKEMEGLRLELEAKEKEILMEQKKRDRIISELEENLRDMQSLRTENQRLKDENSALRRVINKLSNASDS